MAKVAKIMILDTFLGLNENVSINCLVRAKLVSYYKSSNSVILGRYGVNKSTLKKLLKKEQRREKNKT